jgi:hypothetical protein
LCSASRRSSARSPVFAPVEHVLAPVAAVFTPVADVLDAIPDHGAANRALCEQRSCTHKGEHCRKGQRIQGYSGRTHNDQPPVVQVAWLVVRPGLHGRRRPHRRVKWARGDRGCGAEASIWHRLRCGRHPAGVSCRTPQGGFQAFSA